jgi:hypothetical protein
MFGCDSSVSDHVGLELDLIVIMLLMLSLEKDAREKSPFTVLCT